MQGRIVAVSGPLSFMIQNRLKGPARLIESMTLDDAQGPSMNARGRLCRYTMTNRRVRP